MVNKDETTNEQILVALRSLEESRDSIVVLTEEEVTFLREMIADRRAYSRVWNKFRIFLGIVATSILGVITFWEKIVSFVRGV